MDAASINLNNTTGLHSIPIELLRHIASFVPKDDLLRLRLTCRDIARHVDDHFITRYVATTERHMTPVSLNGLLGLSSHAVYGSKIRKIILIPTGCTNIPTSANGDPRKADWYVECKPLLREAFKTLRHVDNSVFLEIGQSDLEPSSPTFATDEVGGALVCALRAYWSAKSSTAYQISLAGLVATVKSYREDLILDKELESQVQQNLEGIIPRVWSTFTHMTELRISLAVWYAAFTPFGTSFFRLLTSARNLEILAIDCNHDQEYAADLEAVGEMFKAVTATRLHTIELSNMAAHPRDLIAFLARYTSTMRDLCLSDMNYMTEETDELTWLDVVEFIRAKVNLERLCVDSLSENRKVVQFLDGDAPPFSAYEFVGAKNVQIGLQSMQRHVLV